MKPNQKNGTTKKTQKDALTVRVDGDLVSTTTASVRGDIDRLLASMDDPWPAGTTLQLDLARAKMIDSMGLNLVVSLLKAAQKQGGRLRVAYADANVLRILTFTRLDKQLELVKV
jgi:anti-anti-sigma factor